MTNETETVKSPAHTPWPWEIIPNGMTAGWPVGRHPLIRCAVRSGHYIAEIKASDGDSPTEVAANARLIAAAPEMLEALVLEGAAYLCGLAVGGENWSEVARIANEYGISQDNEGDAVTDILVKRARDARRAAIAKATGATS